MSDRVSVIVATFNGGTYIGETIRAILGQTTPPGEIIVVDDGSTDGTPERLAADFGSAVDVRTIAHSGVPAVARNHGIAVAKGSYLAFCDHDDVWFPEKLATQLQWMEEQGVGLCGTDALVYGTDQKFLEHYRFRFKSMQKNLAWSNFIISSSALVRRDVLGQSRFPESAALRGYDDYLLWLELATRTAVGFIPQALLRYRVHERNLSRENKRRDPFTQMRILFSSRTVQRYPFIGIVKMGRLLIAAASRIWS